MKNTYDFYKPDFKSEYPTVDGSLTITSYLDALDSSFGQFRNKAYRATGKKLTIADFDYTCFHSPFSKMVQKAFLRLSYNEVR